MPEGLFPDDSDISDEVNQVLSDKISLQIDESKFNKENFLRHDLFSWISCWEKIILRNIEVS